MDNLVGKSAEGIILGCTDIGLLVDDEDSRVPLFDATKIHAVAAVEYALGSFNKSRFSRIAAVSK